jgi:hypothetical protein
LPQQGVLSQAGSKKYPLSIYQNRDLLHAASNYFKIILFRQAADAAQGAAEET